MVERFSPKTLKCVKGNFPLVERISYPNGGFSEFYQKDGIAIVLDYDITNPGPSQISYLEYTKTQNRYVSQNRSVFRFLAEDRDKIDQVLDETDDFDSDKYFYFKTRRVNREGAESSPLEISFEDNFLSVYGADSLKYLYKEYEISDSEGNSYFLDYLVKGKAWTKAVEENGIQYHHPQIIGKERYRKQLDKQNTAAIWGIKLFRFSSEDFSFAEANQSDIKYFFGENCDEFIENGLLSERPFKLYEHQENALLEIEKTREEGIKSFLAVFPTASGKSKIIEEDIKVFDTEKNEARYLILVPNTAVKNDWFERIEKSLKVIKARIEIQTYGFAVRHYSEKPQSFFDYIVVDEAHHAVAPMLKRVIQYYSPDFLIGLTATDERPDKKRLEDIFGAYKTGLSLEEAMRKNIIAEANVYRIETNIDLSNVRINGKEYINADLEKTVRVTSRNELIAQVINKYFSTKGLENLQGIVFCVNTRHAAEMEKVLQSYGISARAYTNRTANADRVMEDFREKKVRFLCSCNMISEGWDYPELGILVMARPTLSKVLYLQQLGRGLRKTKGKRMYLSSMWSINTELPSFPVRCIRFSIFLPMCRSETS
jgi:DNA or RNA helicases of superfamily II